MADKLDLSVFDEAVASTPDEYSVLGAGTMGVVKGATAGFDDEAGGLAMAAVKKIGGDENTFWNLYEQIRDNIRHEHTVAEEQQPTASVVGEIGGGLATALIPGVGIAGNVAKGATLGAKLGAATKAGAVIGGISGLGGSTADLTQVLEKPKVALEAVGDTAVGAGVGGIAGYGGQLVGSALAKGASELGKGIMSYRYPNEIAELIKRTWKGEDLLGKTTETSKATRNVSEAVKSVLEKYKKAVGQNYGDFFQEAEDAGSKIEYNKLKAFREGLDNIELTEASDIAELQNLKKTIDTTLSQGNLSSTGEATMLADRAATQGKAAEKVESKVASEVKKDELQLDRLNTEREALGEEIAAMEDEVPSEMNRRYQKLSQKIEAIKDRTPTEFPSLVEEEALTGRTVHAAPRGIGSPIAATEGLVPTTETAYSRNFAVAPTQAKVGKQGLSTIIDKTEKTNPSINRLANQAKTAIQEDIETSLKTAPPEISKGLETATRRLKDINKSLNIFQGSDDNAIVDRIQDAIRQYKKPGSAGERDINLMLAEFEKSFPGEAGAIRAEILNASQRENLARSLSAQSAFSKSLGTTASTGDIYGGAGGSVHSGLLQTARLGTMAARGAKDVVVNTTKALYERTPAQLQRLADFATREGSKSGQVLATTIQKALAAPAPRRNALLFALMQQPDIRELIRKENPVGE